MIAISEFFEKYFFGGALPFLLTFCGVFFIIYLFPSAFVKTEKHCSKKSIASGMSSLTIALAGTLGVGNITGVASALILGGAGSIFWMWVSALFSMALKYAEVVLAGSHSFELCGKRHGGAFYYIRKSFCGQIGRYLAVVFAFLCLLCTASMGCMLQSSAVADTLEPFGVPKILSGVFIAILAAAVAACNIESIPVLTSVIVPVMTLVYACMSVVTLVTHRGEVHYAFKMIFDGAFRADAATSGVIGFFMSRAVRYGFTRGLLSNEAGCGTSPMAHATADVSPRVQGRLGVAEVFVDTILLCTLTALPLLAVCGSELSSYDSGDEMRLVLTAFSSTLGTFAAPLMVFSVFFFAFATIICWFFYGSETVFFLTKNKNNNAFRLVYRLVFPIFVLLGACMKSSIAFFFSDLALCGMTMINLVALFKKRGIIKAETMKNGDLNASFWQSRNEKR